MPDRYGADLYIGIDWSGAKGEFHKGIQVAEAEAGGSAVRLIAPPHPRGWSRDAVLAHLLARAEEGRVLAGIDFAFAHPIADDGGYYPGEANSPRAPRDLWQLIEDNADLPHLYGGGIWRHPGFGPFYNAPIMDGRGARFQSRRRLTEMMAARVHGRHPSPTFNCVGPAGVGTGSLAGMRLLHRLKDQAVIWPFDAPMASTRLVLAEIFPGLYFTIAGVRDKDRKAEPLAALNRSLEFFGARPLNGIAEGLPDNDDIDALIAAAALRHFSEQGDALAIAGPARGRALQEGWIFGAGYAREEA